jgi:hypothetical protein
MAVRLAEVVAVKRARAPHSCGRRLNYSSTVSALAIAKIPDHSGRWHLSNKLVNAQIHSASFPVLQKVSGERSLGMRYSSPVLANAERADGSGRAAAAVGSLLDGAIVRRQVDDAEPVRLVVWEHREDIRQDAGWEFQAAKTLRCFLSL